MRATLPSGAPVPKRIPTGVMRSDVARRARVAARAAEKAHPALGTPGHLRDAARSLERGNTEGAKRHLRAAMNLYQPASLYRHGVLDDEGHTAGRQHLDAIHRLHLQVQDIQDTEARNRQRDALPRGGPSFQQDDLPGVPQGSSPDSRSSAMNAPAKGNSGGDGGAAQGPKAPIPRKSEQMYALWIEQAIELVGPEGYIHGYIFVGKPGSAEHVAAMHDLADSAGRAGHGSAATDIHRAANAVSARDSDAAIGHLQNAYSQIAGETRGHGISGDQEHANSRALLNGIRQHMMKARAMDSIAASVSGHRAIGLSAETGMLAVTPHPYGKPGGPGLYGVKGLKHSDYLENVVHALMTKRGMDKGKATAIARAALRRWMATSKHPEVRAAATAAEGEELAAQARAKASR